MLLASVLETMGDRALELRGLSKRAANWGWNRSDRILHELIEAAGGHVIQLLLTDTHLDASMNILLCVLYALARRFRFRIWQAVPPTPRRMCALHKPESRVISQIQAWYFCVSSRIDIEVSAKVCLFIRPSTPDTILPVAVTGRMNEWAPVDYGDAGGGGLYTKSWHPGTGQCGLASYKNSFICSYIDSNALIVRFV